MVFYLKDGTACISMQEFAEKFEDKDYRQIAWTDLKEGDAFVSTVWLGLDHNFSGVGKPIIFETMAFYDGNWQDQRRYRTEEEALVGHREMVESLRSRKPGCGKQLP